MGIGLLDLLPAVSGRRVLVVGDTILDVYLYGAARSMSREAPAPAVAVQTRRTAPGGAGNSAANVSAFGGVPILVSAVGDDHAGLQARAALEERHVATERLVRAGGRRTVVRQRVIADRTMLVRLDEGDVGPLDEGVADTLAELVAAAAPSADALLICDHGYGAVAPAVAAQLADLRSQIPVVVVDAKNPAAYASLHPSAATPDYLEAARLLEIPKLDAPGARRIQIVEYSDRLLEVTRAEAVVVTLGAGGAVLLERGRPPFHVSVAQPVERLVVGAGDVFAAVLALALAADASPVMAAEFATLAASAAARSGGTALGSRDGLTSGPADKVLTAAQVPGWAEQAHRQGLRIVFTNGCFDLVHEGHVAFLKEAKALGDVLIVAVNDDHSVRSLKGPDRPVVDLAGRMQVLAALGCVDRVVPFSGRHATQLIESVRPHVFAKGGDYHLAMLPEMDTLRRLAVEVQILSYVENRSTTQIIEQVRSET